jgi:predicted nucleotide-binding protein
MADYYPLIARAVAGLDKNTGDGRRVLYERARAALVAQLRGVTPALDESDVTRERLSLEEAIRKVEGESPRSTRDSEAPPPKPARRPQPPRQDAPPPPSERTPLLPPQIATDMRVMLEKVIRNAHQRSKEGKVFVVHGHAGAEHAVAGYLRKIGLQPVVLHEQANEGRTIIEKFEAHSDVGFAIVVVTPDDVGGLKGGPQRPRARQNVVLELGYFVGRLGREKVCPLIQGEVELPSDVLGVLWVALDAHGGWHEKLAIELRAAGYDFDMNKALRG